MYFVLTINGSKLEYLKKGKSQIRKYNRVGYSNEKKSFIAKSVNVVINKIDASCNVKQFIAITVYATEDAICRS